jgi:hypothetical protein
MLSGESGKQTIKKTAQRICKAKGVDFVNCGVRWDFQLPKLSCAADLDELTRGVVDGAIEVVLIDPLYLCLTDGNDAAQEANLFKMGPRLAAATRACLDVGATPIFLHHAKKRSNQVGRGYVTEPMDLEDLAYAGIAEFARQWLLLSRHEPFDPETGESRLLLNLGGSAGHAGLYSIEVTEGVMNHDFEGRTWEVYVLPFQQAVQEKVEQKKKEQVTKKLRQLDEDKQIIVKVLKALPKGETTNLIVEVSPLSEKRTKVALNALMVDDGLVCRTWVSKPFGTDKEKKHLGWLLYREPNMPHTSQPELEKLLKQGIPLQEAQAEVQPKGE